jgi:hypothetical protein
MAAILCSISRDDPGAIGVSHSANTREPRVLLAVSARTGRAFDGNRLEEAGMSPGTSFHFFHRADPGDGNGTLWAVIIAILFAVVAAVSFAVDQSVTLSNLPAPPAQTISR